jgi:hypothetical protein
MARGEHTDVEPAEVVPDDNVRASNRSAGEEAVQFAGNIRTGARLIGRFAPTQTGAIVGTNTGKSTDLRLNQLPNNGRVVWTTLHDDGWTSRALYSGCEAAAHQCPRVYLVARATIRRRSIDIKGLFGAPGFRMARRVWRGLDGLLKAMKFGLPGPRIMRGRTRSMRSTSPAKIACSCVCQEFSGSTMYPAKAASFFPERYGDKGFCSERSAIYPDWTILRSQTSRPI